MGMDELQIILLISLIILIFIVVIFCFTRGVIKLMHESETEKTEGVILIALGLAAIEVNFWWLIIYPM